MTSTVLTSTSSTPSISTVLFATVTITITTSIPSASILSEIKLYTLLSSFSCNSLLQDLMSHILSEVQWRLYSNARLIFERSEPIFLTLSPPELSKPSSTLLSVPPSEYILNLTSPPYFKAFTLVQVGRPTS